MSENIRFSRGCDRTATYQVRTSLGMQHAPGTPACVAHAREWTDVGMTFQPFVPDRAPHPVFNVDFSRLGESRLRERLILAISNRQCGMWLCSRSATHRVLRLNYEGGWPVGSPMCTLHVNELNGSTRGQSYEWEEVIGLLATYEALRARASTIEICLYDGCQRQAPGARGVGRDGYCGIHTWSCARCQHISHSVNMSTEHARTHTHIQPPITSARPWRPRRTRSSPADHVHTEFVPVWSAGARGVYDARGNRQAFRFIRARRGPSAGRVIVQRMQPSGAWNRVGYISSTEHYRGQYTNLIWTISATLGASDRHRRMFLAWNAA